MAITQPDYTWDVEAVFEELWCPACGAEDFMLLAGGGLWCDRCNTKATVRHPAGDQGYIVDFTTDAIWHRDAEQTIPGQVLAKLLGASDPGLEYWGTPVARDDHGRVRSFRGWRPVTRDSEHDDPESRPVRETVALGTVEAGHYVDGYRGRPCPRCDGTDYTGVSRDRDDWDRIEVVECDGCGKLFDAVEQ